jgi:hypothetical protein
MYPNYAKAILDDLSDQKFKLRRLRKLSAFSKGGREFLQKQILNTELEIESIEQEIDQLTRLAFFPYHDVPILELLTNERYHQGPAPGTHLPPGDS